MHPFLMLAALLALSLGCLIAWWLPPRLRKLRQRITTVSTCGYLPPKPSAAAQKELDALCRFFIFTNVGNVEIEGAEHLAKEGQKVFIFNHSSALDAFVVPHVVNRCLRDRLNRPSRYMTGRGNFRPLFGLIGLLIARWGGFAVDTTSGKGGPVVDAAVSVITSGQLLVMAPEGRTHLDGELGTFKTGAIRIAHKAAATTHAPVHFICAHIQYGRYAPAWMQRMPDGPAYILQVLCFWYFRAGAKVILRSVSTADLPEDDRKATEILRQTVQHPPAL